MHATLEFLQEAVRSSSVSSREPFSVLQLGKSLFTVSFFALVTLITTARVAWRIRSGTANEAYEVRSTIDLGLYWGAFTFGVGAFHTVMGLIVTAQSVEFAAPIEPGEQWLVARGVTLALIACAYGLLVLLLTALAWLGLRRWHRKAAPAAV